MTDLAFLLVKQTDAPDPDAIVRTSQRIGVPLRRASGETSLRFELENEPAAELTVTFIKAPPPDLAKMPVGVMSPTAKEAQVTTAHMILTARGLTGDERQRDTTMAALAAAVIENTEAIGVMLGHGVVFHEAQYFAELAAAGVKDGALPVEAAVSITADLATGARMAFLTHGMDRYGHDELYVTCPVQGKGALHFIFGVLRSLLARPDASLQDGDTVGRSDDERLPVRRVPHPTADGPDVVRVDLPDG
jgi:hypothetical protein